MKIGRDMPGLGKESERGADEVMEACDRKAQGDSCGEKQGEGRAVGEQ